MTRDAQTIITIAGACAIILAILGLLAFPGLISWVLGLALLLVAWLATLLLLGARSAYYVIPLFIETQVIIVWLAGRRRWIDG